MNGFTLLEVVVTITIMAILTALVMAALPQTRHHQLLISARQQLRHLLAEARNRALNEIREERCLNPVRGDHSRERLCSDVGIAIKGNQLVLFADTEESDSNVYTDGRDYMISQFSLPRSVQLLAASGMPQDEWQSLLIESLPPNVILWVNGAILSSGQEQTLDFASGSAQLTVRVFPYGRIE